MQWFDFCVNLTWFLTGRPERRERQCLRMESDESAQKILVMLRPHDPTTVVRLIISQILEILWP